MSTTAPEPVITAGIGARSVPVHLGAGALALMGPLLAGAGAGDGALVVVDDGVAYAGEQVAQSCREAGLRVAVISVPAGEASKNLGELERLSREAARAGIRRRDAVVAVDMHGYSVADAAALFDVAEGTVKSRCARGRARLAVLLGSPRGGGAAH